MNTSTKDSSKEPGLAQKPGVLKLVLATVLAHTVFLLTVVPLSILALYILFMWLLFPLPPQGMPDPVLAISSSAINRTNSSASPGSTATTDAGVGGVFSAFDSALDSILVFTRGGGDARYENWEEEQQALNALIELAGLSEYYEDLRKSPDQRAQDLADQPSSHYDYALELYDDDWGDFVADLDLSPEDKRLLKEMMLLLDARGLELARLWSKGMITGEEFGKNLSYEERGEKLAVLLSPAQVEAYVQHGHDNGEAMMEALRLQREEDRRLGYTDLMDLAASGTVDAVKAAIADGIDVNSVYSVAGWTALMRAARHGHADNVQALIDAGAELDVQDLYGNTPLRLAVQYSGSVETVQALIDAGADVNIRDGNWRTPLLEARLIGNKEIVDALLAADAGY